MLIRRGGRLTSGNGEGRPVSRRLAQMLASRLTNKTVQCKLDGSQYRSHRYDRRRALTCTANAVLPTPPSPSTATLQLSILASVVWGRKGRYNEA
jgi:hypothetical protein